MHASLVLVRSPDQAKPGASGGGARALLLTANSNPTAGIHQPRPSSPLCCIYMFQLFQMYVVINSIFMLQKRSRDVAHVAYIASVSDACCKRLFKMFYLFPDICCNRFYLDIAYVSHMLQQNVPKYFSCFSLML
jgi:hypothetical protein